MGIYKTKKLMSLVASSTTCGATAGTGVVTAWALSGSTTAYTGTITTTDGYQIVATLTWKTPGNTKPTASAESPSDNAPMGMGTCAETLTSASAALATTVTTEGNFALCHWVFWLFSGDTAVALSAASTGTYDWGSTHYLTTTQWGTNGGAIKGSTMKSGGGTALTSTANGLVLSPVAAQATTTIAVGAKTFTWYQPKYATTYSSSSLRRYNGGTADADKVKGYCVAQRLLATASHVATGFTAAETVTLTGASALAASAIALGAVALSI